MTPPRNPFWDWSIRFYDEAGIADICLELQDNHGLDVNLLLFCCWSGTTGRSLSGHEMDDAMRIAASWSAPVIEPLRAVRRHLKPLSADRAIAAFREQVSALELTAERLQQDRLFEALPHAHPEAGTPDPGAAAGNLRAYLDSTATTQTPDLWNALAKLLRCAFPGTAEADIVPLLAIPAHGQTR